MASETNTAEETSTVKDKYLKVITVMERLNIKESYVRDLICEGELKAIKVGSRAIRISEQSLDEFIERRTINPGDLFDPEIENQQPAPTNQIARSKWIRK